MSVSDKQKMLIANVCYANVAGNFAMFTNEKYRGPNFTWAEFAPMMERNAATWMMIHNVRGNKTEVNILASVMAKEIAERLVARLHE